MDFNIRKVIYICYGILVGCFCFTLLSFYSFAMEDTKREASGQSDATYKVSGPLTVTVVLEKVYLDGEISEEIKEQTIWSMEDFWSEYSSWQLVDQNEEQIVFQQKVDDISPLLKANGYFGITDEGIFSIFNGKPNEENVIQSFFQIDVEKLESRQHEELKKGIPIESKDNYVQVLEVFKPFSIKE